MSANGTSNFQARGYMIAAVAGYLREHMSDKSAMEKLSAETRQAIDAGKSAGWYPVENLSEVLRAVAAQESDEAAAQKALVACGRYMASEATNTWFRLLIKMLTPALFGKKLPELWKRDFTHGRFETEVDKGRLVCRLYEIKGFDHCACTAAGFVCFVLETMGKEITEMKIHNWGLDNPCEDGCWFEYSWQN